MTLVNIKLVGSHGEKYCLHFELLKLIITGESFYDTTIIVKCLSISI